MAAFTKYNCFLKDLAEKKHDFANDTFKVLLTNRAPVVATDRLFADASEIAAGNGYAAGGNQCTVASSTQASGAYKSILNDPAQWTAAGGVIGPFRYAVLQNSTAGLLIGYVDYGLAITLQIGEIFIADLDQVAGLFTLT
jgi:hypothetical protein